MTVSVQRCALAAMGVALIGAEIVRPTTYAPKRIAYHGSAAVATSTLGQLELDDLPPIVQPALGNIDVATVIGPAGSKPLVPGATVRRGAVIRLIGWCADPLTRSRGSALLLIVDRKKRIDEVGDYSTPRPDVAKILRSPAALYSGFRITVPTAHLATGTHEAQVAVVAPDERTIADFPIVLDFLVK